jgi:hypothetical protein
MQAWASIHGHPKADIDNAGDKLGTMYYDALNELPYLTGGKSGDDVQQDERMAAIERYRDYHNKVIKPGTEPAQDVSRPKSAHKHRQIPTWA